MLSILIPIYNYSVLPLVEQLIASANKAKIAFEIIAIDDASTIPASENTKLHNFKGLRFIENTVNKGRAGVRNELAKMANFDMLLFIDADMKLPDESFIERYLPHIEAKHIAFGGLCYHNESPDSQFALRWKYGHQREALTVKQRLQKKYLSTKTCNLIIPKSVFMSVQFNEDIKQYGHEDTLFSIELERNALSVHHVNNPLIHEGLESAEDFLKKVRLASENLAVLEKNFLSEAELMEFNLLKIYYRFQKLFILRPILFLIEINLRGIERNLKSAKPKLWCLDMYKAFYFDLYRND